MRTAADIANAAADIIGRHGLAKRDFQDSEGRYCFNGALAAAVLGEEVKLQGSGLWDGEEKLRLRDVFSLPEIREISSAALQLLADRGIVVYDAAVYNNARDTTQADVVKLLRDSAVFIEESQWLLKEFHRSRMEYELLPEPARPVKVPA